MKITGTKRLIEYDGKQELNLVGEVRLTLPFKTVADPGDTNTIAATTQTNFICSIVTAGVETRVLGAPNFVGQRAIITLGTDGGDLTMTNASGWLDGGATDDVATFDDAGDSMIVEAHGTAVTDWRVTSEKGVAFG